MMKIKTEKGFALLLSIFIILAFSIFAYICFYLLSAESYAYLRDIQSMQAFYLAEAAREFASEYYISWGTDFSDINQFPDNVGLDVTRSMGNGTLGIEFEQQGHPVYLLSNQKNAYINYRGTIQGVSRLIQQYYYDIGWFDSLSNPYFWGVFFNFIEDAQLGITFGPAVRENLIIRKNSYQDNDNFAVWVDGNLTLTRGRIGHSSVGESRVYVPGNLTLGYDPPPNPNCDNPPNDVEIWNTCTYSGVLDRRCHVYAPNLVTPAFGLGSRVIDVDPIYYDQEIAEAESIVSDDTNETHILGITTWDCSSSPDIDLGGKNWYIRGKLDIQNCTISGGPANIVSTEDIDILNSTIGGKITIISAKTITTSGTVWMGDGWNETDFDGAGCILYAKNEGDVNEGIIISSNTTAKAYLLSPVGANPANNPGRAIRVNDGARIWGILLGRSINPDFGEFHGSVVTNDGIYNPAGQDNILTNANIIGDTAEVPIALKGVRRSTRLIRWKE